MDEQHQDYYAKAAALEEHFKRERERERINRMIDERWPGSPRRIDTLIIAAIAIGGVLFLLALLLLT
jgi:hypothetical protein